jgi:hypothetical protein
VLGSGTTSLVLANMQTNAICAYFLMIREDSGWLILEKGTQHRAILFLCGCAVKVGKAAVGL